MLAHSYKERGNLGGILRAARENLGLDRSSVALVARQKGMLISEERLEEIEADHSGAHTGAEEWYDLTRLLYESADSYGLGFEPWIHLRRVQHALQEGRYHFPMNFTLRRKLIELARRDRVEKCYSDLVFCAVVPKQVK